MWTWNFTNIKNDENFVKFKIGWVIIKKITVFDFSFNICVCAWRRDCAFVTSDYPVILSLENHCNR